MDNNVRKGIHFDLDTKMLEKYYPTPNWRRAYDDIKAFMCVNGFEHEQGSGYHSKRPMHESRAFRIVHKMRKKLPWLNKCVRVCTISDVPAQFDISDLFDKDLNVPEREASFPKGNMNNSSF